MKNCLLLIILTLSFNVDAQDMFGNEPRYNPRYDGSLEEFRRPWTCTATCVKEGPMAFKHTRSCYEPHRSYSTSCARRKCSNEGLYVINVDCRQ